MSELFECMACKKPIRGRVVWLAEDYRNDGGCIDGPYTLHEDCARGPWPLYEVTAEEAAKLTAEKAADINTLSPLPAKETP